MIEHQGIYLPDGETHLTRWMTTSGELVDGKGTYQINKLRHAVAYCTGFRTAVDVGGHAGMWSMQLAKAFQHVHAFEPVAAHRACFERNLADRANVQLYPCALGEREGAVRIYTAPTSSGDSYVDGDGDIPMHCLDSFGLETVDFIKLDCEGYELFALRGAVATLAACRPVVIVEQKPGKAQKFGLHETEAVSFLQGFGYRVAEVLSGDYILVPQ